MVPIGVITYVVARSFGASTWQALGIEMILCLSLTLLTED